MKVILTLATASNAIIIGFNVRPTPQAKLQAESDQVDIRLHRIIYNVIDEIETAMKGMLDPEFEEKNYRFCYRSWNLYSIEI